MTNSEIQHPSISVCIVCFNEENNIRRCLESVKWVKEYGGEIVVVDSFSTD
ncbi:MAG: glycosyltransferase, partial [Planctomycetota bacterium]